MAVGLQPHGSTAAVQHRYAIVRVKVLEVEDLAECFVGDLPVARDRC